MREHYNVLNTQLAFTLLSLPYHDVNWDRKSTTILRMDNGLTDKSTGAASTGVNPIWAAHRKIMTKALRGMLQRLEYIVMILKEI